MENFLEDYAKLLDDSKTHLTNKTLATYHNLKDLLSSKEKLFIENHLKDCLRCKEKYDLMKIEDREIDTRSDVLLRRRGTSIYWYAAAAIILITLGISYLIYVNQEREPVMVKNEEKLVDSLNVITENKSKEDKQQIEEIKPETNETDFAANKTLENFINRNIRGETHFKIITPIIGDTLKTPLKFEWQSQAKEVKVSIVNNKNQEIISTEVSGTSYLLEKQIKSGRYYWKIFVDGKLVSVGMFFVM
jgi:hypothetical protein